MIGKAASPSGGASVGGDREALLPATAELRAPRYHVTTTVAGRPVAFMEPIPDPLARTTVTLDWRDLLRGLLRRRLTVEVSVGADSATTTRLLELDPDYLGPRGSASRTAWEAELHGRLRDV